MRRTTLKQKAAASAACGLIGGFVGGLLVLLYELQGDRERIWPFPKSGRVLFGISEIFLWGAVVIAVLVGLWVLFAVLFEAAGWYNPNKSTRQCPRCYGKGTVSR